MYFQQNRTQHPHNKLINYISHISEKQQEKNLLCT